MSSITAMICPISVEFRSRLSIVETTLPMASWICAMPSTLSVTACLPRRAASAELSVMPLACCTFSATCWMLAAISSMEAEVSFTAEARVSVLPATCWMLAAISEMELEVSSTDAASSCALSATCRMLAAISSMLDEVSSTAWEVWVEAAETVSAEPRTFWTIPRRLSCMEKIALPSWSRSLWGVISRVRSPLAMSETASAMPER
ncbi:hypothetical protein D3C87_1262840 [compost metagenome]